MRRPSLWSAMGAVFVGAVPVFLTGPLILVASVSFNAKKQLRFPPEGFSVKWYGAPFTDSGWVGALQNSVVIALAAGTLSVMVALPLALCLWSRGGLLAKTLFGMGIAPSILPPVISAPGFLVFWILSGVYGGIATTMISHGIFLAALPLVTISPGLEAVERPLIEAAETMGANRRTVFLTAVLPLIRPYIISGFAFAFVLGLNEYIIACMVAGFTAETLPIKIFNAFRYGYTPIMAVSSALFFAIAIAVFGSAARFGDLPRLLGAHLVGDR